MEKCNTGMVSYGFLTTIRLKFYIQNFDLHQWEEGVFYFSLYYSGIKKAQNDFFHLLSYIASGES